ncbi:sigma-70 family RNA polymerase sigma factor [Cellulomonas hominis]|uniref:sigma-70 family RNA polymerase sigma factor n=1 Tax=Cellulomonas hominis TaxID=156981 RepID=UPI001B8FDEF3|nr:sigma-70 family RNA polymerase sigma factor [Cellulomonas hominis]VTR78627.1 RNA polymerase sigma-E factor [Cellulomonas hominis]
MAWERGLESFVRERGDALVGYAYLLTGDLQAAEDLAQEGLVRTWTRRRTGADVEWLEAYVRRCILHAFVDGRRRAKRWRDVAHLVASDERSGDAVTGVDDRAAVLAALAHLTPRQRACVVLRFYEDMPVREIAAHLDLSEGAVKRYLHDAHRALAPRIGAQQGLLTEDIPTTKGGLR